MRHTAAILAAQRHFRIHKPVLLEVLAGDERDYAAGPELIYHQIAHTKWVVVTVRTGCRLMGWLKVG